MARSTVQDYGWENRMKDFHVVRLGEDGKLEFDPMLSKPKLQLVYSDHQETCGLLYKDCRLTAVIEPTYTILERSIRWLGFKLNIEPLCSYHQKSASYDYSFESVEEWTGE